MADIRPHQGGGRLSATIALVAFFNAVAIAHPQPAQSFWNWNRPNSRPSPWQMPVEARPLRQASRREYPDYWNGNPPKSMSEYAKRIPPVPKFEVFIDPPSTAQPWGTDRYMRPDELRTLNGLIDRRSFRREGEWRYGRFAQRQSRKAIKRLGQPSYRDNQNDWFKARDDQGRRRFVRVTYDSEGYAIEADSDLSRGYRPRPMTWAERERTNLQINLDGWLGRWKR